jgi:hypothetical protein
MLLNILNHLRTAQYPGRVAETNIEDLLAFNCVGINPNRTFAARVSDVSHADKADLTAVEINVRYQARIV